MEEPDGSGRPCNETAYDPTYATYAPCEPPAFGLLAWYVSECHSVVVDDIAWSDNASVCSGWHVLSAVPYAAGVESVTKTWWGWNE